MKTPKFKAGDILVDGRGWKRKIMQVVTNYLGEKGRFGYYYATDNRTADVFDEQDWMFHLASQEHILARGYRKI